MLDGLPLAIELAAARTRLLSPQALVARLGGRLGLLTGDSRDLPERHRSLRSTIAWSYDLLSPEEQEHFRDLSVFSGGARLDAVEAVCGGRSDVFGLVTALVDHSLVRAREDDDGQPRFTMLETLREYAEERLLDDARHAREVRQRHARHYLDATLDVRRAALEGETDYRPTGRDEDNVRAALGWLLRDEPDDDESADARVAARLDHGGVLVPEHPGCGRFHVAGAGSAGGGGPAGRGGGRRAPLARRAGGATAAVRTSAQPARTGQGPLRSVPGTSPAWPPA